MKYSIIIPHLNEGYYLNAMFDSIYANLHYDSYEIIVVDDGSDEKRDLDFIHTHPLNDKIQVIFAEKLGSAGARNLGAQRAKGKYLVFLDAHMYVYEDFLTKFDTSGNESDIVQMVVGSYLNKRVNGYIYKIADFKLNSGWSSSQDNERIVENPCSSGAATITKCEVFEKLGGFNPHIRKWGTEDLEFPMRAWLYGYNCTLDREIGIAHYYKVSFENTTVYSEDVVFNRIMFAYTCFQNPLRHKLVLSSLREAYGEDLFDQMHTAFLEDKKVNIWFLDQQKKFKYNDDWYFKKFDYYYNYFNNLS